MLVRRNVQECLTVGYQSDRNANAPIEQALGESAHLGALWFGLSDQARLAWVTS